MSVDERTGLTFGVRVQTLDAGTALVAVPTPLLIVTDQANSHGTPLVAVQALCTPANGTADSTRPAVQLVA